MTYDSAVRMIEKCGLNKSADYLGISYEKLRKWMRIGVSTARGNLILAAMQMGKIEDNRPKVEEWDDEHRPRTFVAVFPENYVLTRMRQ